MNKSAQVGDILKDRHGQDRVVDNVMNFFRSKEPENGRASEPQNYHNEDILDSNKLK